MFLKLRLWRKSSFKNSSQLSDVSLNFFCRYCCNANRSQSKQFDVILLKTLFGDILSDEASAITGP
jgi:isocitrate/isopropylmalate dehydrogenase